MTDNNRRFAKFIVLPFAAIVFIGALAGSNNKSTAQAERQSEEAVVPASKCHGRDNPNGKTWDLNTPTWSAAEKQEMADFADELHRLDPYMNKMDWREAAAFVDQQVCKSDQTKAQVMQQLRTFTLRGKQLRDDPAEREKLARELNDLLK